MSITAGRWRQTLHEDRHIPQSAKRFGDWLSRKPVAGKPGRYKGGQRNASVALGLAVSTVSRAETTLIDRGYVERVVRGTYTTEFSQFELRLPSEPNMAKPHVDQASWDDPSDRDQHALGDKLIKRDQLAVLRASRSNYRYGDNATSDGPHAATGESSAARVGADIAEQGSRRSAPSASPATSALSTTRSASSHTSDETQPPLATTDPNSTELVLGRAAEGDE